MKYLTFEFDLWRWVQSLKSFVFLTILLWLLYGAILGKLVKPFMIYQKLQYLTFDFDLSPWCQGHRILFFYLPFSIIIHGEIFSKIDDDLLKNEIFDLWFWLLTFGSRSQIFILLSSFRLYGYYMVQLLAKSIKPFRIYRKRKYLTFNFYLWPLVKVMKKHIFFLTLFICIYGTNLSKIDQTVQD